MRSRFVFVVLGCLWVLVGCRVSVDVELAVATDGTGTLTIVVTADQELVAKAPEVATDLRVDDLRAAGWTVTGPDRTADGGLRVELVHAFTDPDEAQRLLGTLNGPGGPLRGLRLELERSFARTTTNFTGEIRLDGLGAFGDDALTAALGGTPPFGGAVTNPGAAVAVSVVLRAPGRVLSGNGAVEDGSVRWVAEPVGSSSTPMQATVEATDTEALAARDREALARRAFVVWAGLIVVGAVLVAVWLLGRRRRPRIR